MKTYKGNVTITKDNQAEWEEKLRDITEVTGYVRAEQGATINLPKCEVTGDVIAYTPLPIDTERALWKAAHKQKWFMSDTTSEWLLEKEGNIEYKIGNITFDNPLFDKVRKDQLTAQEVFALANMEQRRIAYERMDKIKMKELPNLKVLHEVKDDGYKHPMHVISFNIEGYNEPFKYLNCFCATDGREYFLETKQDDCWKAKAVSFGLDADNIEWVEEW